MRIYYEAWLFVQLQGDMVVALLALSCTVLGGIFLLSSSAILATSSPTVIIHHQL
jgi:hypothetical protein